ncbi:nucleotide exchange factor GrpE [Anaerobaca lacustris]|uniref:Protein GrpE n=1 Tax=Anaerobaca lacustris TaxID=3044600 RepID=A0AAW6U2Q7_9BACT|nr:nucleotide exchange factor GrpE [Sedimentisphaerales bacterium M17dextr]
MKDKKNKPKDEPTHEEVESLRTQLVEVQKERDDLLGKLQRVSADYANFQKRAARQVAESIAYEKETLIKTLLPTLDNFEHTLEKSQAAESVEAVLTGVRIVYDQMSDVLRSHGVEAIESLGQPFDPAYHEAMMRREDPERQDNTVLEEFQKGYKLNGRVVRPSRVIVNKLACAEAPPQTETPCETPDDSDDHEDSAEDRRNTDTE